MSVSDIVSLLTGIALFLFGMTLMGDGLKKVSGNKLEPILYRLSNTLPRGVLLGTGVTAVIQSSCATAVMTVGFVNSGMMKLRQAISVILGAILGTSITGWVICLSYIEGAGQMAELASTATLTGIIALAGVVLRMFTKKRTTRSVGDIMLGFTVLMVGMSVMSSAVRGLGNEPWFTAMMTGMSNPILGILIGALFTALLQSASAAVGILQALSMTGAITMDAACPLLLGIAFGASAPVLFSALGASAEGRRAALVYPVATGIGVVLAAAVFYGLNAFVGFDFLSRTVNPFSIATANTVLRLGIVLVLFPFTGLIERVVTLLAPSPKGEEGADPGIRLEERFLMHPALAVEQSRLTINEMAEKAEEAIEHGLNLIGAFAEKEFDRVTQLEELVDRYEDSLGTYLVKLTGQDMTKSQNDDVSEYLHTLSDFERISDHALNLAESAREMEEKGVRFSDEAAHEMDVLRAAVSQVVSMTVTAFKDRDLELSRRVEPLEVFIDDLCDRMKMNHVERLQKGTCTISQGFVFNDIVTNCERVSDHCSNVAVAMIELNSDVFQTHEYLNTLRETESDRFKDAYEEYLKRFPI